MRLDQRENQRNGNGRQQIGSQRIGSQAGGTASQLARNDGCRRSRRTDQTNHSPLEHFPIQLVHRTEHQQGRNSQTRHRLKQQQPDMPCLGFQFAHLHFAEREQQLGKNKQRCQDSHQSVNERLGRCQHRNFGKKEICQCTGNHGYRQRPVLEKSNQCTHNVYMYFSSIIHRRITASVSFPSQNRCKISFYSRKMFSIQPKSAQNRWKKNKT